MALEEKRTAFQDYLSNQKEQGRALQEQLNAIMGLSCREMMEILETDGRQWPGAFPTSELDDADEWSMPWHLSWDDHTEARTWALSILRDRPVGAVDGSQITPTTDIDLPIGAVQIGWFVNDHKEGGSYEKDVAFEVLAPEDLSDELTTQDSEQQSPERQITQVRFERECRQLERLMGNYADAPDAEKPLFFFDGSFIISFAGHQRAERSKPYIDAVTGVLNQSTQCRVPIVAFVDNPHSRDVISMMGVLKPPEVPKSILDVNLFAAQIPSQSWGGRSPFFVCAREDGITQNGRANFYQDVVFTYMRLNQDRPPARIEMPKWLLAEGRAEEIINLVRAECVVGTGYPYAIETADALAVIRMKDRERFYALLQKFASEEGLEISWARKLRSKQTRRI